MKPLERVLVLRWFRRKRRLPWLAHMPPIDTKMLALHMAQASTLSALK